MSSRSTLPAFGRALLAVAGLGLCAACTTPPPMRGTSASAEEVVRQVLAALAQQDRPRLEALAVTAPEFEHHVWPHLPAARPERNLPMRYVWGDLQQKSGGGVARAMDVVAGRALELVRVRFADAPRRYGPFVVHGGTTAVVRGPTGATEDLRVCGSLIEKDGRWKVFSYVTSD